MTPEEEREINRLINMHEERILYSYNHPMNPFFFAVRQESEEKLKELKQQKVNLMNQHGN